MFKYNYAQQQKHTHTRTLTPHFRTRALGAARGYPSVHDKQQQQQLPLLARTRTHKCITSYLPAAGKCSLLLVFHLLHIDDNDGVDSAKPAKRPASAIKTTLLETGAHAIDQKHRAHKESSTAQADRTTGGVRLVWSLARARVILGQYARECVCIWFGCNQLLQSCSPTTLLIVRDANMHTTVNAAGYAVYSVKQCRRRRRRHLFRIRCKRCRQ